MGSVFDWTEGSPRDAEFSPAGLDRLRDSLAERGTHALLIARSDQIVYEWYAPGWDQNRTHYTASLAKALVGGTSLLLALGDGLLGVDDRASQYVPAWAGDPQKSQITIRHLATHTSGIEDAELGGLPHAQLPGWKGRFWQREPDPFTIARDEAPVVFSPGSRYAYSNPGMAMLAYCVTAALRGTAHQDIRSLLRQRVFDPIGLRDAEWSIGYGTTYEVDRLALVANWGGGNFTPRAVARLARLMLHHGGWEGSQLLDPAHVKQAAMHAGMPLPARSDTNPVPASGLCWYTNFDGVWPEVPRDAFAGAGAGHQILLVVPSLGAIVVRNGEGLEEGSGFWGAVYRHLFVPLMSTMTASNA
jgi:CubicO group peptidase (beta-lactamase class C family)